MPPQNGRPYVVQSLLALPPGGPLISSIPLGATEATGIILIQEDGGCDIHIQIIQSSKEVEAEDNDNVISSWRYMIPPSENEVSGQ
jgi:hypothetical protein